MSWQLIIPSILFGATIGSFLNVCIYRIPREENIAFPASHCPACNTPILWKDNIPILGWLMLRGKCRACQEKISIQYPMIEAIAALMTAITIVNLGPTPTAIAITLLLYAFLVLAVIDLYHGWLPDLITKPGIVLGPIVAMLPITHAPIANLQDALIGLVAGGGFFWFVAWSFEKITKKEGLGFGDVKLLALIGAWLGWQALPLTIFFSSLIGSVVGIIWLTVKSLPSDYRIPYGPYLIIAAITYIAFGNEIHHYYFHTYLGLP
ncbi:prepilin peptidase [Magnetococcales bacterium HHB-1]